MPTRPTRAQHIFFGVDRRQRIDTPPSVERVNGALKVRTTRLEVLALQYTWGLPSVSFDAFSVRIVIASDECFDKKKSKQDIRNYMVVSTTLNSVERYYRKRYCSIKRLRSGTAEYKRYYRELAQTVQCNCLVQTGKCAQRHPGHRCTGLSELKRIFCTQCAEANGYNDLQQEKAQQTKEIDYTSRENYNSNNHNQDHSLVDGFEVVASPEAVAPEGENAALNTSPPSKKFAEASPAEDAEDDEVDSDVDDDNDAEVTQPQKAGRMNTMHHQPPQRQVVSHEVSYSSPPQHPVHQYQPQQSQYQQLPQRPQYQQPPQPYYPQFQPPPPPPPPQSDVYMFFQTLQRLEDRVSRLEYQMRRAGGGSNGDLSTI